MAKTTRATKSKTESAKPSETTATGTTSYSVNASFCDCGAELPNTCNTCGNKLDRKKAQELHNTATHPE